MNLFKMLFTQDQSSYNITMVLIYIVFALAALAICIFISNKLKMYGPKVYKSIKNIRTEH